MEENVEIKYKQMTETSVKKLVCRLAVPTIITMLITSLYNMADAYFIGKINTSAAGAVGVVFSFMAIIQAVGFFLGQGSGNYISRKLGHKDINEAERMASTGVITAIILGSVITILGFVFLEPLAIFLGSTDTILPYAKDYLGIIVFGAPYMTASLVLNNCLRFQGNAFYGMIGMVSGAILNIVLDPVFIFTLNMGNKGAALATILSQVVSFIVLLIGSNKGGYIKIKIKNFSPCIEKYKEIIKGGTPSFCRQVIASIGAICLNYVAGPYGDSAITAMTIVSKVVMFAMSALIGFGQGFQPVCGFNYGAGLYDRVIKAFWFCVRVSVIFLVVVSIIGQFFAEDIIMIFCSYDNEVIEIGAMALRMQCILFFLNGFAMMSGMIMQNLGKTIKASILGLARQGLFYIPIILVLSRCYGIFGIEISQMVADAISFVLSVILMHGLLKELHNQKNYKVKCE